MKHEGRSASTAQGHNGACMNTWEQGCSVVHGSTGQGARGCSKNQGAWVQKRAHGCKGAKKSQVPGKGKTGGGEKKEGKPISLCV